MGKTCSELFEGVGCTFIGNAEDQVEGLAYGSKAVWPGDAFFCIVGHEHDGHTFAQEAIDNGAKVLVVERVPHLADSSNVTEVVVGDTRKAMGLVSAAFYGNPSAKMDTIGVVGAQGRGAVAHLTHAILQNAGRRAGVVGSGVMLVGADEQPARVLCESPDLQRALAHLRDERCSVALIGINSESLFLDKTWGTSFAVTAFTDRSQGKDTGCASFEPLFEADARLFSQHYPARRVICVDSPWGRELFRRCSAAGDDVITTGFDPSAQIHFLDIDHSPNDPHVTLEARGSRIDVSCRLADEGDAQDLMCSFGIAMQLGMAPASIATALAAAPAFEVLRAQAVRFDAQERRSDEHARISFTEE